MVFAKLKALFVGFSVSKIVRFLIVPLQIATSLHRKSQESLHQNHFQTGQTSKEIDVAICKM